MKPSIGSIKVNIGPAAFRRLCVETFEKSGGNVHIEAAAFRRLCVETLT